MAIDVAKFRSVGVEAAPRTRGANTALKEKIHAHMKTTKQAMDREEVGNLVAKPLKAGWQDKNGKAVWALLKDLRIDGKVARRFVEGKEYFAAVGDGIAAEDFSQAPAKP